MAESRPRVRKMAVDSDKASYSPMTAQHPMYFRWCVRMAAGEEGGCVLKCLPSMHFLGRTPGAPTATIPWRQSYFSAAVQPNRKIRHGSVTTRAPLQCAARFQMDAFVGAKTVDGGGHAIGLNRIFRGAVPNRTTGNTALSLITALWEQKTGVQALIRPRDGGLFYSNSMGCLGPTPLARGRKGDGSSS